MERLTANVDVRPSTRLTLSGTCGYENVNASDSHQHGNAREKGSECVRGAEGGIDCERLLHEERPSKKMLRSKEEGCANASVIEDVNGYLASVRLNVSEDEILNLGNESVND